jgi:hypothetical protein
MRFSSSRTVEVAELLNAVRDEFLLFGLFRLAPAAAGSPAWLTSREGTNR